MVLEQIGRRSGGLGGLRAFPHWRARHECHLSKHAEACADQDADSEMARDAFATFIPISVDSDARTKIVFDFFDLLAAIAAHGKSNGLSGRKLSRLAGWWAFEQTDTGTGFDGGYKSWAKCVTESFPQC